MSPHFDSRDKLRHPLSELSPQAPLPPMASLDRKPAGAGPAGPVERTSSGCTDRCVNDDDLDVYAASCRQYEVLDEQVSQAILRRRRSDARQAESPAEDAGRRPSPTDRPGRQRGPHGCHSTDGSRPATNGLTPSADRSLSGSMAYAADRCVHGGSAGSTCDRCAAVCPVDAIQMTANGLRIDAAACTDCGVCSAVCPTGAMTVSSATVEDLLTLIHSRIADLRLDSSQAPAVIFHQPGDDPADLDAIAEAMPHPVITVPLTQIGWVGPEVWLGALAYGARQVLVRLPEGYPPRLQQAIDDQRHWTAALLDAIDNGGRRIQVFNSKAGFSSIAASQCTMQRPAQFSPFHTKRDLIRHSAIHLAVYAGFPGSVVPLPQGAPFGRLVVDAEACTLCMACCGGCPTGAISPAGDVPALKLTEALCIQCGRCERLCPENAVRCRPQLSLNPDVARQLTLNEQQPFTCIRCGKGFAAPGMVAKMVAHLHGHWMYRDESALRRLKMCGDCRVRSFYQENRHEEMG